MQSILSKFVLAIATAGFCVSSTAATANSLNGSVYPSNPLVTVSLFGTPASAQAVCAGSSAAAGSAAAATAAQGQANCVLPAVDAPPPPVVDQAVPPPLPAGNFGVNWLLLGLGALALVAGLQTLFDDDDLDSVSP